MCENCFNTEYPKFRSESEYNDFIKVFNSKIEKTFQLVGKELHEEDFHKEYQCNSCKQIWWLSDPDSNWRGYFLKAQNAKKVIENERNRAYTFGFGCLLLAGFLIFLLFKAWFR